MIEDACIVATARSPIGRHGGALASVRPDDLAAHVLAAVAERAGLDPARVDEVFMGCANQAGEDNRDVARMAALLAGFPETVPGVTVNRLCGSGMEAVAQGARAIMTGDAEVVIAGGVESMSRAPLVMAKAPTGYPIGAPRVEDSVLGWRFVNSRMEELGHTDPLGITAENVAEEYGIGREEQDEFAVASQRKAIAARESGRLAEEIAPLEVHHGRAGTRLVEDDEGPRADTEPDRLARLRPAFKTDGTVTAGNSSTLNDGAAAVALASRNWAEANEAQVLATVRSIATVGVPPRTMGIGPVPATDKALVKAGLTLADIGLIELNEAFAAQALAVLREWGIEPTDSRLNVNGGAISLGHPLGCSGARLIGSIVHELPKRPDVRYALATMCIGVGQGIAVVLEAA